MLPISMEVSTTVTKNKGTKIGVSFSVAPIKTVEGTEMVIFIML